MLVLSRKAGERISIGPEVEVTVLGISRGKVKLGFTGPPHVSIHREEAEHRMAKTKPCYVARRTVGRQTKSLVQQGGGG